MSNGVSGSNNLNTQVAAGQQASSVAQVESKQPAAKSESNLTIERAAKSGDFAGIAQSLGLVPPAKSNTDLMTMLQKIRTKLDNSQLKTSEQEIQNTKTIKKHKADERIEKLREAAKPVPSWIKGLQKFAEVSAYIGAVGLIAVGAAFTATGLGATWGVPMLIAGVTMLSMAAATTQASESGDENFMQAGMNGAIDGIAKGFEMTGMSPELAKGMAIAAAATVLSVAVLAAGPAALITAPMLLPAFSGMVFTPENMGDLGLDTKGAMIASIVINSTVAVTAMVGSLGVGIVVAVATGGAGAVPAASAATRNVVAIIKAVLESVSSAVSAATQVMGGAASIGEGVHKHETGDAEASSQELKAGMAKLLAQLDAESERIAELMKRVSEGADIVMNVMSQEGQTMDRTVRALGASRSMA